MIERQFVTQKLKEFQIQEFIAGSLKGAGHSFTKVCRTPLGEKIVIYASRPGLVVGSKGENIKKLTKTLKRKFDLENPQIEISEVDNINLDAQIVAERIANSMERFGSNKFKGIGHKAMSDAMDAGALGIEIIISGKIPGARAKRWRFYQGYLKKCGDVALTGIRKAQASAKLKSGIVGIKVSIMPPDIVLPDKVTLKLLKESVTVVEEIVEKGAEEQNSEKKETAAKKERKGKERGPSKKSLKENESKRTKTDEQGRAGE